jgi:hypothetical protein
MYNVHYINTVTSKTMIKVFNTFTEAWNFTKIIVGAQSYIRISYNDIFIDIP